MKAHPPRYTHLSSRPHLSALEGLTSIPRPLTGSWPPWEQRICFSLFLLCGDLALNLTSVMRQESELGHCSPTVCNVGGQWGSRHSFLSPHWAAKEDAAMISYNTRQQRINYRPWLPGNLPPNSQILLPMLLPGSWAGLREGVPEQESLLVPLRSTPNHCPSSNEKWGKH